MASTFETEMAMTKAHAAAKDHEWQESMAWSMLVIAERLGDIRTEIRQQG